MQSNPTTEDKVTGSISRRKDTEREYYGIKGQSFAFAPRCNDVWFAGYLSYWGKIFDKNELWREEKLRTLIRDCFASLQATPSRRSLLTKLGQQALGRLLSLFH